jgi:diguanylate cyclase (GGDEF)-like protein
MTKIDRRRLIESVTRLVEKPDLKALDQSLVATVREIIAARAVRLCPLHEDADAPHRKRVLYPLEAGIPTETSAHKTLALESAPAFAQCLESQRKVEVPHEGGVRIIHPLRAKSGATGFLVLDCDHEDPHDQEVVSILLAFYRNYASLLHDNQRDELTGLLNRKTFDEKVLHLIAGLRSLAPTGDGRGECCLAVLDIDHFKHVNDRFGHLVGDETLVLFARDMVDAFRGSDLLFRIGGEEFVVVLRDVDLTRALAVLERFRHIIEERDFPQIGRMTISAGVSQITAQDLPTNALDRADKAMYCAKSGGRNRIYAHEHLVAEGKLQVALPTMDAELF